MTAQQTNVPILKNFVGGQWVASKSEVLEEVLNPATGEAMAYVPLSTCSHRRGRCSGQRCVSHVE